MYSAIPSSAQWNPVPSPSLDRTLHDAAAPPLPPTSPTRRLRGLSYLRSYTQNHILSRDSHNSNSNNNNNNGSSSNNSSSSNTNSSGSQQRPSSLARATSYPSPTSNRGPIAASTNLPPHNIHHPVSPSVQHATSDLPSPLSSTQENHGSTSGWLPTVAGQSGVSRIATEPQSTSSAILSVDSPTAAAADGTPSMARTRSATTGAVVDGAENNGGHEAAAQHPVVNGGGENRGMSHQLPSIRFSAHQDPRAQRPSLVFPPMARILPTGKETIKVGRYSERENQPSGAPNVPSAAPVGFKSKVVSRRHCEFWYSSGRWYIRDVKSSSGTFLNHIRLSSPGTESRPFPVNDGDIVQLGIDFKGGEEMIFRCVKIRVELNKGWQTGPSSFNVHAHKRLRELNNLNKSPASSSSQDCSICLGPIAPCQSLFVAPCSHTWHYKCIRVIINGPHWPHFICPNCRSVADLEAELEDPTTNGDWEEVESEDAAVQLRENAEVDVSATAQRRANETEDSEVNIQVDREESERGTDLDIAETSDDSDVAQGTDRAAAEMGYMQIRGTPLPSESNPITSNATSAPVDIISRKPVGNAIPSSSSRVPQRQTNRTPSPTGLGDSLEVAVGAEGPMTPRNDAGPFIFDGSAGRASGAAMANMAAAANSPSVESTPVEA